MDIHIFDMIWGSCFGKSLDALSLHRQRPVPDDFEDTLMQAIWKVNTSLGAANEHCLVLYVCDSLVGNLWELIKISLLDLLWTTFLVLLQAFRERSAMGCGKQKIYRRFPSSACQVYSSRNASQWVCERYSFSHHWNLISHHWTKQWKAPGTSCCVNILCPLIERFQAVCSISGVKRL